MQSFDADSRPCGYACRGEVCQNNAMDETTSHCIDVLRQSDRDRFLSVQFAPADVRAGLYALYALNQDVARAAEIASEPLVARMRVQWWRDAMPAILAGSPPAHPIAEALSVVRDRLDGELLEKLLMARADDADAPSYGDFQALQAYLEVTSTGLGMLALGVLGVKGDEAARCAIGHAGMAWGILGIVRAVPFWAARRRCFLPHSMCEEAGLDLEALYAGLQPSALRDVVLTLMIDTSAYLAAARSYQNDLPSRALAAVMTLPLADGHVTRLAKAKYDPYNPLVARGTGPRDILRLSWRGWRGRY